MVSYCSYYGEFLNKPGINPEAIIIETIWPERKHWWNKELPPLYKVTQAPRRALIEPWFFGVRGVANSGDGVEIGYPDIVIYRITGWDPYVKAIVAYKGSV